jgi:hypothetical protein
MEEDADGILAVLLVGRRFLSKLSIESSDEEETIGPVEFCGKRLARSDKIRICSSRACFRDLENRNK